MWVASVSLPFPSASLSLSLFLWLLPVLPFAQDGGPTSEYQAAAMELSLNVLERAVASGGDWGADV